MFGKFIIPNAWVFLMPPEDGIAAMGNMTKLLSDTGLRDRAKLLGITSSATSVEITPAETVRDSTGTDRVVSYNMMVNLKLIAFPLVSKAELQGKRYSILFANADGSVVPEASGTVLSDCTIPLSGSPLAEAEGTSLLALITAPVIIDISRKYQFGQQGVSELTVRGATSSGNQEFLLKTNWLL